MPDIQFQGKYPNNPEHIKRDLARVQFLLYSSINDLNDWKVEFLEDKEKKLKADCELTDYELMKLEEIEDEDQ